MTNLVLKNDANKALKAGLIVEYVAKGMSEWQIVKTKQIPTKADDNTYDFRISEVQIKAGQIWGYIEAPHVSLEDVRLKVLASAEGYVMYKRMGGAYVAHASLNVDFLEKYKKIK